MSDPIKMVNGVPIYLDPMTGKFNARMGGRVIRSESLRSVEKQLGYAAAPLRMILVHLGREVYFREVQVVGTTSAGNYKLADGSTIYGNVIDFDQDTWDQMCTISEQIRLLSDQFHALTDYRVGGKHWVSISEIQVLLADKRAEAMRAAKAGAE